MHFGAEGVGKWPNSGAPFNDHAPRPPCVRGRDLAATSGTLNQWTRGTPGFGVSRRERSVCVVEIQAHARPSIKICHAHIPTRLVGVVETQVHSWGTLEKISTHISSHIYAHTHVYTRPFRHIVCTPLVAGGNSPHEIHQQHEKKHPASMWPHTMAITGTHSQPGHAWRLGTNTQATESAKSATP